MPQIDPSLAIAQRIDLACDRFETEWKAGKHPRIEDFVSVATASDRAELRKALLAIELELQGRSEADTSVIQSSIRKPVDNSLAATVLHPATSSDALKKIGRFELRGVLGSGAFGKVYRAFDSKLNREVAIKVPMDSAVKTDVERMQFLKVARAIATINHPNVCQVFEVGEFGERPYIVMALVSGLSLADALKSRKAPFPQKQVALIIRKIAAAIATAHEKGIVHRDLKPANIMFDRDRKDIVVMDFGLARGPQLADARSTQSGVIIGTPAYMSPEQARGDAKGVGPSGDVFSLGVILYEMLTGCRPFVGTATEVIGQILHVEPERPSQRRAGVDPGLESICLKAMAKDPASRFSTMKELAIAIDSVLRENTASSSQSDAGTVGGKTRGAEDPKSVDGANLAAVFAVISTDRKKSQAETAAVVEAAIRKTHTPRWVFVALGLVGIFGIATLAGLIFFTRSGPVTVTLELNDIDLTDQTLSFLLDDKPISAEALANPIELRPGEHILVVKRGDAVVKRLRLNVTGGRNPGIKVKGITPPDVIAESDRSAAKYVLSIGGKIQLDDQDRWVTDVSELPGEPFRLTRANLDRNQKVTDHGLSAFAGCQNLKDLDLTATPITDAGLVYFKECTGLTGLALGWNHITDKGLANFKDYKNLRGILIHDTDVSDTGLAYFKDCSHLETIWISGTQVTDKGVSLFKDFKFLKWFDLRVTKVSADGYRMLKAALPNCQIDVDPELR